MTIATHFRRHFRWAASAALAVLALAALAGCAEAGGCPGDDPHSIARAIAYGHAYHKHVAGGGEFDAGRVIGGLPFPDDGIATKGEFADFIAAIIAEPDRDKRLQNRRHGYWDDGTGTVVIHNARARDCGTAFRPNRGVRYYLNLN